MFSLVTCQRRMSTTDQHTHITYVYVYMCVYREIYTHIHKIWVCSAQSLSCLESTAKSIHKDNLKLLFKMHQRNLRFPNSELNLAIQESLDLY